METHDSDTWTYLNRPERFTDKEVEETHDCDLWSKSNCCTAPLMIEHCSDCREWADTCCSDCDIFEFCINPNKITQ